MDTVAATVPPHASGVKQQTIEDTCCAITRYCVAGRTPCKFPFLYADLFESAAARRANRARTCLPHSGQRAELTVLPPDRAVPCGMVPFDR